MANVKEFVDELRMLHAGAEEALCSTAAVRAIIEMCQRGNLWRQTETVSFGDKKYVYLTSLDINTDVSMTFNVTVSGTGRRVLPPEAWEFDPEESKLSIVVGYACDISQLQLDVEVVIVPNIKCTTFPDVFFTKYYNTVIVGASSYLKSIGNRPWTNVELGQYERKRFLQQIGTLRSARRTAHIHSKRSWGFR